VDSGFIRLTETDKNHYGEKSGWLAPVSSSQHLLSKSSFSIPFFRRANRSLAEIHPLLDQESWSGQTDSRCATRPNNRFPSFAASTPPNGERSRIRNGFERDVRWSQPVTTHLNWWSIEYRGDWRNRAGTPGCPRPVWTATLVKFRLAGFP
jgi:hypothetical protein